MAQKERFLLILQNPTGSYFLSGKYFQINDKLESKIAKKYPKAKFIKIAEWSKELFDS